MQKIINPYNFISFGSEINKNKKSREEAYRTGAHLLSGWLDVNLIPSTPLIIPDGAHPVFIDPDTGKVMVNPQENEKRQYHTKYEFMNRSDENGQKQYYIPGSSLRGMIRSVYEAATDSCVPFLLADKKKPISQRVPLYAALKQRGLLSYERENGEYVWKLYSTYAETEMVTVTEEKTKKKSVFHFMRPDGSEVTEATGSNINSKGILQYNVPVDISKDYHIAYLTKKECIYTWKAGDDEAYRLLNSVLMRDNVKGNHSHRNSAPAEDLKKALDRAKDKNGNLVPVYYFKVTRKHEDYDEELVYLSNSSVGRIAQKRTWADIMANHGPCKGEKLCPACLLFGSMDKDHGVKSRVRITDALPDKKNLCDEDFSERILDILGEPRTSAFEFYLERPKGASYWNFDFYGMNETDKNGVNHTRYHDLSEAMPRGRKMYWHGEPQISTRITKLNSTMKATSETFTFKIYFDEITQEQLKSLIWVLTLGENSESSQYQHKLGHAKPLGYGSVKLIVTGKHIRTFEKKDDGFHTSIEHSQIPEKTEAGIDMQKPYVRELLRMSDRNVTFNRTVSYPTGKDKKIFTWFSENRLNAGTVKILPNPLDDDIELESSIINTRSTPNNRVRLSEGEIVDAIIDHPAKNKDGHQFGFFVKLPGGISGLLHKKQMQKTICDYSEGQKIKVKISEIKEERGRKKYSVTDKIFKGIK